MSDAELFFRLSIALENYDQALVMTVLLAVEADSQPFRCTQSKLATRYLGGLLNRNRVDRAIERLHAKGLVATRIYPKTWSEYTVDGPALAALLRKPLPPHALIPGVSHDPIPFIAYLEGLPAAEQTLTPASSESPTPPPLSAMETS
jgi:hypothetical protein